MNDYRYIGEKIPRVDGLDKATGHLKYMTDLKFPNMLYGKAVRAPHPHCILNKVDTSAAESMPGVCAVLTYKDVPGENLMGLIGIKNQPVFAEDKTRFLGDTIVFIAAESLEQAEKAAKSVKIDYTPLPVYTSPLEAMKEDAVKIHENGNILDFAQACSGDVDAAFAEADFIVENTYYTHRQHHGYIETLGGWAVPDENGGLTVYAPVQNPYGDRAQLSSILGMPAEKITVVGGPGGGGFGGKDDLFFQPHMAIAALKTGRPVFCHADREETMLIAISNQPFIYKMRTAVKKDGTFLGQDVEVICDTGAYCGLGLVITRGGLENCCGSYYIPNVRAKGYTVHTNQQFTGEWKGFGNNQTHFSLESQVDAIARLLRMDPIELRRKNALKPGNAHSLGHQLTDAIAVHDTLDSAEQSDLWRNRDAFKADVSAPWLKRGVGLASCIHPFTEPYTHSSGLEVSSEGKYTILASLSEHGAGTSTALCIMAAEALGVALSDVSIQACSTAAYHKDAGPITASRANYAIGNTTLMCVRKMQAKLIDCASRVYDIPVKDLQYRDGMVIHTHDEKQIDMCRLFKELNEAGEARVEATLEIKHPVAEGELPDRHSLWSFMTQIAGVEVDTLTGKTSVLIADAHIDVGRVINKLGYEGQVEGGIVMGMGMALMEELLVKDGNLISNNFQTYMLPTAEDMPEIRIRNAQVPEESGPFGAKGIGEMPAVTIVGAIANAVYDAVGVRMYDLPITPEKLYTAMKMKQGE